MGLGLAAVQNTLELWQQGLLNTANKVVEMGSQELHLKTADFKFPYQGKYLSEQQGHFGFNRVYHQDPPGYSYISLFDSEGKNLSGKMLLKTLVKKTINKIIKFR